MPDSQDNQDGHVTGLVPLEDGNSYLVVSDKLGPRPPRRGGSFESETGFVSDKSSPRPGGSSEEKHPIVIKDEPRMNTNTHESRWTHSNDKRHQNASATLSPWNDFVSVVDNPAISVATPPNQHLIIQSIGVHSCPFVVRRFRLWMTLIVPSCPFVDYSFTLVSGRSGRQGWTAMDW